MVQTLREVWRVHYVLDEKPPRWRKTQDLPPVAERMQSPYDPEAHFSMKRQFGWTGYKVHVTEICDDDAAHLITDVKTCPSMQPDMASTAGLHERLAAKGLLPAGGAASQLPARQEVSILARHKHPEWSPYPGPVQSYGMRRLCCQA